MTGKSSQIEEPAPGPLGAAAAFDSAPPAWRAIRLATVTTPSERWSQPHPAWLRVNESAAARLSAPVPGRVSEVFVELGASVKAGEKLFSLSSPALSALRIEQRRAVAELDVARAAYERIVAMVNARALPGKAEIDAQARVRHAELSVKLANEQLASLRAAAGTGGSLTVVAPRSGVIVAKRVLTSQLVTTSDVLIEVADPHTLWAVAEVFEIDVSRIEPGAPVRLTSPNLPDWSLTTKVDVVASMVDPRRHTVSVRVSVPNPDLRLRSQTYVEMSVLERVPSRSVEIPSTAVGSDGHSAYVYLASDTGRFVKRLVQAGSSYLGRVLVLDGLLVGEKVVEQGVALLDNERAHDDARWPADIGPEANWHTIN